MSLEEDEMSMSEGDLSHFTDFVRSCMEEDDIVSSSSSSSMDSSDIIADHEIHDFGSSRATRVKFARVVTERFIMSLDEYTQDEIEESWWTPDEKEVMDKDQSRIVERLEAGLKEEPSAPYRGLEGVASGCHEHMMETQKAYVDTVVSEQERQRNEKRSLDWEKIASLTKEITKQSTQEALLIALYDEKEADANHHHSFNTIQQSRIMKPSDRQSKNRDPVVSPKNKKAQGLKPYCSRILLSLMKKH